MQLYKWNSKSTNLKETNLSHAIFKSANLKNGPLNNVILKRAHLKSANLTRYKPKRYKSEQWKFEKCTSKKCSSATYKSKKCKSAKYNTETCRFEKCMSEERKSEKCVGPDRYLFYERSWRRSGTSMELGVDCPGFVAWGRASGLSGFVDPSSSRRGRGARVPLLLAPPPGSLRGRLIFKGAYKPRAVGNSLQREAPALMRFTTYFWPILALLYIITLLYRNWEIALVV